MFKKVLLTVVPLLFFSLSANAGFVLTDYQTTGDNQAVLHEETGIEWLNLNQTIGMSIGNVERALERGEFTGWRMPSIEEVNRLYSDFFGFDGLSNVGNTRLEIADEPALEFASLFGETYRDRSNVYSFGQHLNGDDGFAYRTTVKYNLFNANYMDFNVGGVSDKNYFADTMGVFLVSGESVSASTSVPEPTSLAVLAAGLMCFGLSRRKKKNL